MGEVRISVTGLQAVLDCPRCFWISDRVESPPSIFPGVLSKMDSVVKHYMEQFVGSSDLPEWFPVEGEFLGSTGKFKAIDLGTEITVAGELDALAKADEGYYIVDYKTSKPKDEVPPYYQTQLDGYAYLLEQNDRTPVAGAYLLYFYPEQGDLSHEKIPFQITPTQTQVNPARIPQILSQAERILERKTPPPPNDDCDMCNWLEEVEKTLE